MSNCKYVTVYADPPWPIKWSHDAQIGKKHLAYPTMPIAEIAALDIKSICAEDCNLFLWTTNQFLPEALWIVRHWGFNYEMLFTWCKNNGMGGHPRNATEHMIISTRGRTFRGGKHDTATLNWLSAPKGEHSEKPNAIRKIVEKISPPPRIELFARKRFDGWNVWGDEVSSDVQIPYSSGIVIEPELPLFSYKQLV